MPPSASHIVFACRSKLANVSSHLLRTSRRHYKSTHISSDFDWTAQKVASVYTVDLNIRSCHVHVSSTTQQKDQETTETVQRPNDSEIPCGILPETTGSCWLMLVLWFCLVLAPCKIHDRLLGWLRPLVSSMILAGMKLPVTKHIEVHPYLYGNDIELM